jgi:DNA-binding HxlR family transcriptional regulator
MLKSEKFDPFRRSVGHVLDIIGEGWSILIIREAFLGTRRFEEFQGRLGIARNILTARLKNLCANQILDRVPVKEGAKRHEYVLTRKGKDMMPLLVALTQWGDKWVFGEGREPVLFLDRERGEAIEPVVVRSSRGEILRPRDIRIQAGPGATDEARQRIEELYENGEIAT